MQATAGLRALEGDASDRILQAVIITHYVSNALEAMPSFCFCFFLKLFVVSNFSNLR